MFSNPVRSLVLFALLVVLAVPGEGGVPVPTPSLPPPLQATITASPNRVAKPGDKVKVQIKMSRAAPIRWLLKLAWEFNGNQFAGALTEATIPLGSTTTLIQLTLQKRGTLGKVKLKATLPDGTVTEVSPIEVMAW